LNFSVKKILILIIFFAFGFSQNDHDLVSNDSVNIQQGSKIDDFNVTDDKGQTISFTSDILGERKAIVLVFFRGFWWPHCRKQLVELSKLKLPNNVKIYAISNEEHGKSKSLQKQLKRKQSIHFLRDNTGEVFEYFGIIDPRYSNSKRDGIPYASTYVVGNDSRVSYSYIALDYKKRPTSDQIIFEINKVLNK